MGSKKLLDITGEFRAVASGTIVLYPLSLRAALRADSLHTQTYTPITRLLADAVFCNRRRVSLSAY